MSRRNLLTSSGAVLLGSLALGWMAVTLTGCEPNEAEEAIAPYPPPERLVIITPHNPMIRELFGMGFSDWHHKHHGRFVDIQWITRGTVECLRHIESAATEADAAAGGRIPDLLFGGGITDHNFLIRHHLARAAQLERARNDIPATVGGLPTRDPQGRWYATALSGFGIIYHKKACRQRGIAEPTTWADLAKPEYYGWVSMADPTRSGSNRQCLTFILQKHGWRKGWGIILRMLANCRALLHHSSDVISDVSAGVNLAGLTVNFTALHEIELRGEDRLAYVSPPGASAITPDLVTVLTIASNPALAERFLQFCLSEEGQVLWGVKAEERQGYRDTLYRYPIDPGIYERYAGKLWVTDNPFAMQTGWTFDPATERKQAQIVPPLVAAAGGENHILLQNCWKRIMDSGMNAEALAVLVAPPFDEETAYELGAKCAAGGPEAQAFMIEWSKIFRQKYEQVASMLSL